MAFRLAFIALLFLTAPIEPADAQSADGAYSVHFTLHDNRIFVPVSGPGFENRPFLLDTGAQATHYTSELVAEAGLRTSGNVGITGTGAARIAGAYVPAMQLRLGAAPLSVARGVSAPRDAVFGAIYASTGRAFDGVIGYDLFAAYVVEIDYASHTLRLYDPRRYHAPVGAQAMAIRIVDHKPYIDAVIDLGQGVALPANLHLDTGFSGALALNGAFVAQNRLTDRAQPSFASVSQGVGGPSPTRVTRFEALRLGSFTVTRPIATLAIEQGAGVRTDAAGRVGGDVLRRFVVTFDYRARALWLQPGADLGSAFEADMSGLTLIARGDAFTTIVVSQVAPDTPGARAGVNVGDELVSLDGQAAADLALPEIRALLRVDGVHRQLEIRRGGQLRTLSLVLARRI